MGFCTKCGTELTEQAKFCYKCGTKTDEKTFTEELEVRGSELVEKVKTLIHEGNVRRIIIKDQEGRVIMEIPLTFGVIGTILAPILAALGAIAVLALSYTLVIERRQE
jgi:uncharacterized membrane protein YvbJ